MPEKKLIGFLLVQVLFFSHHLHAQVRYQKYLDISYETGPLISNGKEWADELIDLVDYRGLDARIGWRKIDNSYYNHLYRYPVYGLGYTSALPYYPEIGRPQAIYVFAEFPLSYRGLERKFSLDYFGQIGLGFNLNPYDPDLNPINQFIGSQLNAYIHLGFKANYQITDRFTLFSSIGLKHYSNGATRRPNAGINLVPLTLGVRTRLGKDLGAGRFATEPYYPDLKKRGFWNIAMYMGSKNYEIGDPAYFRGGIGVNYLWEADYKYRLGLGMDLFVAPGMAQRFPGAEFGVADQLSLAVVGSWEWKLSERVYVPIGLGVYLKYNRLNQESWFYERVGVRYRFRNHVFAGLQIKAHKAKADFFEFTVGYTIPGKVRYTSPYRPVSH